MSTNDDRKEKIIHARVPEDLDRELKMNAGRLGLSVSNLVRNVLQNAFGLVEGIVVDSAEVARTARGETAPVAPLVGRPPAVLGYQPLVLAMNALCHLCNAILPKGSDAALLVTDPPGPRVFVCSKCVKEVTHASTDPT